MKTPRLEWIRQVVILSLRARKGGCKQVKRSRLSGQEHPQQRVGTGVNIRNSWPRPRSSARQSISAGAVRESTDSWAEVFRALKARGLAAPKLLMADVTPIWAAARTVWPEAGEQRCWNHKMRNVLDRLPQREQSEAKELLRTVVYASTRAEALKARQAFGKR